MTINNRIELIINSLELNNNSFSMRIGVNSTVIHNIVKGRNAPSYDVLQKILSSFDNISADWLITEKGEMVSNNKRIDYSKSLTDSKTSLAEPLEKMKRKEDNLSVAAQSVGNQLSVPCPNCSVLKHALEQTERALKHAESEIEARKETILLLTDKINDLTKKIDGAGNDGQKRKAAS
jgi:transcriptional regulator with XRE-family HTH domain